MSEKLAMFKSGGDGIQVVSHTSEAEEVKLVPLGDVHLGSPQCQVDKFVGTIDYIKESGSLCVLMGD